MKEEALTLTPYRCRFCHTAFNKPQALSGHMNNHAKGKTMSATNFYFYFFLFQKDRKATRSNFIYLFSKRLGKL